jgi:proteasome accessory factor A
LFLGLEADGRTTRITTEEDIDNAMTAGPSDTRGGIRGLCIRRFSEHIKSVQWERVTFNGGLFLQTLNMDALFEPEQVEALGRILSAAATPSEALDRWNNMKGL